MMGASRWFHFGARVDVWLLCAACIAPVWFVRATADLLHSLGLNRGATAYALVVGLVAFASSFIRRWASGEGDRKRALANAFVAIVGLVMLLSVGRDAESASPSEITSPYLSYLISVGFAAGVGYAFAGMLVYLVRGSDGRKTA